MTTALSTCLRTDCAQEQAWNEEQLAKPVTRPSVHLWCHETPGIVLGRAQRALAPPAGRPGHIPTVVRGAGGGAVLTGPWLLSASIVLPCNHPLLGTGIVSSYRWLGVLQAGLLRDMGIDAHALSPDALQRRKLTDTVSWACFGGLSPWEVTVGTRKITGLAQIRRRHGVLLTSGTLVFPPDWGVLCLALEQPVSDAMRLATVTTSCADHVDTPMPMEVLAERLGLALSDLLGLDRSRTAGTFHQPLSGVPVSYSTMR